MEDSKFQFKGFIIKKAVFDRKDGEPSLKFNLDFSPRGLVNKKESCYQLHLGVKISDELEIFIIEVEAIADFYFDAEIDPNLLGKMFYINAPAILFPYVRAYITTLTTLSGLKPLILPTLNLISLGEELKKNTVEVDKCDK